MEKMKVYCGTKTPREMTIDLDDYGVKTARDKTGVDLGEYGEAYNILKRDMNDGDIWINDGHRNEYAVDDCIALWVMGYNPVEWFGEFLFVNSNLFYQSDTTRFMEHVERVGGYLRTWGPDYRRGDALRYTI